MNILGLNVYHGDAAAALVQDGVLIAAAEEERFNRVKHCAGLPIEAIRYCCQQGGIGLRDIDYIAVSRNPWANFWNKAFYSLKQMRHDQTFLKSRAGTVGKVLALKTDLVAALRAGDDLAAAKLVFVEHHLAHMASSFFVSPFKQAALLSIDGFGDFVSTKTGIGDYNQITTLDAITYPHSAGILYTATTQFLGFQHYGDEGKIMGLAPYGQPRFMSQFKQLVQLQADGRFALNLDYFQHHLGSLQMSWLSGSPTIGLIFSPKFSELFGPARQPKSELTQTHMDIAASLQLMLEEIYMHVAQHLQTSSGMKNLCLSGGVALNGVANGKLLQATKFEEIYIQPAAGDGGTSVGAAFYLWNQKLGRDRGFVMHRAAWGPSFCHAEIAAALQKRGLTSQVYADPELYEVVVDAITAGQVVGWFQGRMEFGPRALGQRSILADPRRPDMKDILNQRIKHRETFRPFAPSVMQEHAVDFFTQSYPSPFMLMVYPVKPEKRDLVPAITHVDGSGRLQTVNRTDQPRYYDLIAAFYRRTGIPMLLNTSFNENEPIVMTPDHALDCFLKTKMDLLVMGNHVLTKATQAVG